MDRDCVEPPVVQIHRAIARAVHDGTLPPGTRLPTVRALAAQCDVAVNTAAKAFRRLEEAGLVITRGRAGTVVAPLDDTAERLERAAREYADVAVELGLDHEAALRIVDAALADRAPAGLSTAVPAGSAPVSRGAAAGAPRTATVPRR